MSELEMLLWSKQDSYRSLLTIAWVYRLHQGMQQKIILINWVFILELIFVIRTSRKPINKGYICFLVNFAN